MHWCENLLIVVPRNADHMSKALVPFIEKARFQLEDAVEEWSRIRIPESVSLRADGDLAYMCRGYQEEDLTFQEWFDRYGKRPLIFQAFLPQPPGLKKQAEERWRKTHWGTISEANYWQGQAKQGFQFRLTFPEPRPAEGYLQYFFASAGGPPLPVIRAVCEQHPDLGFIYLHEPRPGQLRSAEGSRQDAPSRGGGCARRAGQNCLAG